MSGAVWESCPIITAGSCRICSIPERWRPESMCSMVLRLARSFPPPELKGWLAQNGTVGPRDVVHDRNARSARQDWLETPATEESRQDVRRCRLDRAPAWARHWGETPAPSRIPGGVHRGPLPSSRARKASLVQPGTPSTPPVLDPVPPLCTLGFRPPSAEKRRSRFAEGGMLNEAAPAGRRGTADSCIDSPIGCRHEVPRACAGIYRRNLDKAASGSQKLTSTPSATDNSLSQ